MADCLVLAYCCPCAALASRRYCSLVAKATLLSRTSWTYGHQALSVVCHAQRSLPACSVRGLRHPACWCYSAFRRAFPDDPCSVLWFALVTRIKSYAFRGEVWRDCAWSSSGVGLCCAGGVLLVLLLFTQGTRRPHWYFSCCHQDFASQCSGLCFLALLLSCSRTLWRAIFGF
jgi:hypothetical protein